MSLDDNVCNFVVNQILPVDSTLGCNTLNRNILILEKTKLKRIYFANHATKFMNSFYILIICKMFDIFV